MSRCFRPGCPNPLPAKKTRPLVYCSAQCRQQHWSHIRSALHAAQRVVRAVEQYQANPEPRRWAAVLHRHAALGDYLTVDNAAPVNRPTPRNPSAQAHPGELAAGVGGGGKSDGGGNSDEGNSHD